MNKKQMEKYLEKAIHYIFHTKPSKKKAAKKKKLTPAQECGIPEPDHEHGYTYAHLRSFLSKKELKEFGYWIYGQTCAVDEKTRECVIYPHDVWRFMDMVRRGTLTYWD